MLDTLWNIGSFIIALGLLVTVHEYGHFWVARRNGVSVKRFCIGFGKVIYSRFDKHGTEFAVAAIPLGGYVSMLDERIAEVPEALKSHAFNNKSVLQRMAITFAGPAANFIFAIVALWLMYMLGQMQPKPIVGSVDRGSLFEQAGIAAGDEIVEVNGQPTPDWNSVNLAMAPSIGDETMSVETVNRDTKRRTSHIIDIKAHDLDQHDQHLFKTLGLRPFHPQMTVTVAEVTSGSAAQSAGLQAGDVIVKLNDTQKPSWREFVSVVEQSPNMPVLLEVERAGTRQSLELIPQATEREGKRVGFAGVAPVVAKWRQEDLVNIQYGPVEAIGKGVEKTYELVKLSFVMLGKLITAEVSVRNLSGPISIAQGAGQSADLGFVEFLWFLALISVNLGVINLLPLPILDGGHLFYYTIELIRGKSVSERVQQIGFFFGAVVLLMLMSIALINDITRLS